MRDWFAGLAMQMMYLKNWDDRTTAYRSYKLADEMLRTRSLADKAASIPISRLPQLNARVVNAMHNQGCWTVADVLCQTKNELMMAPNFGAHSLAVLEAALAELGHSLEEYAR